MKLVEYTVQLKDQMNSHRKQEESHKKALSKHTTIKGNYSNMNDGEKIEYLKKERDSWIFNSKQQSLWRWENGVCTGLKIAIEILTELEYKLYEKGE